LSDFRIESHDTRYLIRGPLVGHAALGTEEIGSQRRRDLAIIT
jgi:23S rRNA maturation-related 3'-5' exoribonuclease YhaM